MTRTLTHEPPTVISVGDSIEFLVAIPSDYADWTPSARLTGARGVTGTVTVEGSDWHVTIHGQATGGTKILTPGPHQLTLWATSADQNDRVTVAQFPVTVVPDQAAQTPTLTHAAKMLAVVEAAIEARLSGTPDGGIEGYTIDGTAVTKLGLPELEKLRARYAFEVRREQNPNAPLGSVQFVFTPTGGIPDLRRRFG